MSRSTFYVLDEFSWRRVETRREAEAIRADVLRRCPPDPTEPHELRLFGMYDNNTPQVVFRLNPTSVVVGSGTPELSERPPTARRARSRRLDFDNLPGPERDEPAGAKRTKKRGERPCADLSRSIEPKLPRCDSAPLLIYDRAAWLD